MTAENSSSDAPMNWLAVGALYTALLLGIGGMLYWGEYRNATWLSLIGAGGACTAYGRVLVLQGQTARARWWKRGGAVFYVVFFVWAGMILLQRL